MKGTTALLAVLAVACQGGARKEKEKKVEPPPVAESPPPEQPVEPAEEPTGPRRALLVAEDGYWVAIEGQEPKKIALDKAALATELDDLQSRHSEAQLDLAAEDAVSYQEVVTAMDTALAKGMRDVSFVGAASLPVKLPPASAAQPTRCNDNAPGAARPADAGSSVAPPIATLPIIIVKKDGSGSLVAPDGKKIPFAAPKGCEENVPAMVDMLKAGNYEGLILQADKDATAGMIHRVVRSGHAAGVKDVLFAVKP